MFFKLKTNGTLKNTNANNNNTSIRRLSWSGNDLTYTVI